MICCTGEIELVYTHERVISKNNSYFRVEDFMDTCALYVDSFSTHNDTCAKDTLKTEWHSMCFVQPLDTLTLITTEKRF